MVASLTTFNDVPIRRAVELLATCLDADEWCATVAQGRPFESADALGSAAMAAARALSPAGLEQALAAHPRIGDRPAGTGLPAAFSRAEQSGVADDAAARATLRQANIDYEERFGHVFLIRAAGRDTATIVAEARRRLGNDVVAEGAEVREQLGEIAVLRLRQVLGIGSTGSG